ncbi:fimbrial biogenesis outer membrane usher protein [Pseudomonas capeferrum]|uniref:fimbria/pilus outer membrane usher protein n=1 Tax=Pseudomonas capeferrum TaxID=1495066 RepID=UPI0015E3722A|nr:fimbria/pilus outer membrane usher protein [Pseudomonas capeferrum]MBA1205199.1 fimbrial biogenesis outer membrane usher protein [Pseudomonas capeferrum]
MILRPLGRGRVRLRHACLIIICISAPMALADSHEPSDMEFQAGFLRQDPRQPTGTAVHALRALSEREELPPGRYPVRVQVNLTSAGLRELLLEADPASGRLRPCLSPELLDELGLRLEALPDPSVREQPCLDLPGLVPGALADFDSSQLQLAISIPQIALRRDLAGQVDPASWDNGIPAAFVNYQASMLQSDTRGQGRYSNQDLYLNGGINLGGWRLRSSQSWRQDNQGQRQWSRAYTYAQHDLPGTWGNITLGQSFTSSDVFRGIPVSGMRLASDFDMLPDTHRSYAPTLRGVAQTRAKLEVWQNGYPIYSTYVSPGSYAIDDLNVGGTGELEVVLTEADGQVRRFTQPYASISNLLRPGVWRYSTTLGRYNPAAGDQDPLIWQGTLALGTVWNATLYGGLMASEGYTAEAVGIARDLGAAGALSFDVTHSSSDLAPVEDRTLQGLSYAIKYSKAFNSGTHLRFAGYRYSTQGYRDFDEWINQRSSDRTFLGSRRSRLESSINQRIGQRSALSLSVSQQDYWQRGDVQRQFQFNFSTQHKGISYSFNGSQSLTQTRSGSDRQFGLTVSIPLEFGRSSTLSLDLQHSAHGTSQRAALSSHADRLSYNASVAINERQQQSAGLSLAYQAPQATVGAGISASDNHHSLSLNLSGAALVHADGVELGPYLGETIGLLHVPDIADVGLQNNSALRTNAKGYALVPHLRPYRANQLVLDTDRLSPEVDIDNGTATVTPRRGAIVKSQFNARRANRVVLTLLARDQQPLPFGTQLHDTDSNVLGMVGQAGRAMLSLNDGVQRMEARWGDSPDDGCLFQVDPQSTPPDQGYRLQTLTCK